jgi:hypothetical protein
VGGVNNRPTIVFHPPYTPRPYKGYCHVIISHTQYSARELFHANAYAERERKRAPLPSASKTVKAAQQIFSCSEQGVAQLPQHGGSMVDSELGGALAGKTNLLYGLGPNPVAGENCLHFSFFGHFSKISELFNIHSYQCTRNASANIMRLRIL